LRAPATRVCAEYRPTTKAGEHLAVEGFLGCVLTGRRRRGNPRDVERRPDERAGGGGEDDSGRCDGEEKPPERGPREAADALDRARRDVRGGQLLRVARQRRDQRRLRRLEGGGDHGDERGEGIDGRRGTVGERDGRRSAKCHRADRIGGEHDPLTGIAVGEDRCKGRDGGRGKKAEQRH
jgi:hypothetical protein